ncbi:MAG: HypC/HybG/HupF family hydrogenase formation chaperone [Fervidobacterium sp.]
MPNGFENTFIVAVSMLKIIAKKMNKEEIDDDVIRQYYIVDHSKVVDKRYEEMGDFDPLMCRVKVGKIISIDGKMAKVKTEIGEHEYRTDFVNDLRKGDTVIVHYDFICEKMSDEDLKNILNRKPIL